LVNLESGATFEVRMKKNCHITTYTIKPKIRAQFVKYLLHYINV